MVGGKFKRIESIHFSESSGLLATKNKKHRWKQPIFFFAYIQKFPPTLA